MSFDIRDLKNVNHSDIVVLNFISPSPPYIFRKHFRQGLRSCILEVLDPVDVTFEKTGTIYKGVQSYPRAVPRNMLRIFRNRLKTFEEAWDQIERFKILSYYLAPNFLAHSYEFIVDYNGPQGFEPILCGLQEYIDGEILDPWTILSSEKLLQTLFETMKSKGKKVSLSRDDWINNTRKKGAQFVDRIKDMVTHSGYIPDLAGVGNLRITANGEIRLVDLNNVSPIPFNSSITLDEKGYPISDKSVESLSLIEEIVIGQPVNMSEHIYKHFLDDHRRALVEKKMDNFNKNFHHHFK